MIFPLRWTEAEPQPLWRIDAYAYSILQVRFGLDEADLRNIQHVAYVIK